ncbi:hypothetical protein FC52_GL000623 [Lactobacillus pasteurii DSM 23907 = CRBIP 24.76]|uniref:DUF2255 family protein n=1 Tax=Lactobacillus pasteurii DSM 23907 = CRBIP 24.76 TaxID=1423790 RepID=I7JXY8_9LACO|nr:DUF2255 family protein [Lactobacillus pasteurii]KRK07452.1 hypothetical protein FC52_GL000623 [Lactobacillus pasteurii DSM 23907 = CRBIP 24.76]TDG76699.1 hypothetical protein C5L33_000260 [Lactobacillus pasteurii]CCI85065.1 Putative uncharacterized protein [Lactobacillus pasteurii DSM 23907 = CRBIP 24.76]
MSWSSEELAKFKGAQIIQNRPYNERHQIFEDSPIWVVTTNDKAYLRGGKGIDSSWYKSGIEYGGEIELAGQVYSIAYEPVTDQAEIQQVSQAYEEKYRGQYPIEMMLSDKCAQGTVSLIKR